ncbi:bifunctional DNA primase/polymerase [Streptomyces sp. NPDC057620]|uniref:bifunctional DNA primase/polymerase n=1 Tax=Streptomyces sp. NPDC057620 TaxID=3346185 RepID=UPI003691B5E5
MTELRVPEITEEDDSLAAGLKYAAAGWYVLPVDRATKHAGSVLGKGWPAKSSRDPEDIVSWFAGSGDSLALHAGRSGAVVFDIDHPENTPAALSTAIIQANPPYQSTRASIPGRGHYVFSVPEGRRLGNGTGGLGKGWGDVRGLNGIIIVAPSVHEKADEGARYLWETHGPVPVLPEGVSGLLRDTGDSSDAATDNEVRGFLAAHTSSARPALLSGILTQFAEAVATGTSRHEALVLSLAGAVREAAAGMYPAQEMARRMLTAFTEVMSVSRDGVERTRSAESARGEFMGVLAWSIGQLKPADVETTRQSLEQRLPREDHSRESYEALIADPEEASQEDLPTEPVAPILPERPTIYIDHEPAAILDITETVRDGHLPETYVRGGQLVQVAEVSGSTLAAQPLSADREVHPVTPDSMRRLLAQHADVFKTKHTKSGGSVPVPASPAVTVCKAVLSATSWPGLPVLINLIAAPVLRPDGSVLQTPGYDAATGLYYAPQLDVPAVPEVPDVVDVQEAREFVFDYVLGDFPWASPADRANFIALLMSPILRPYIGGLIPLGAISAADRGSGKTLLADVIGTLYGATVRPWVGDDDELRKAITATLMNSSTVVVFDNVSEYESVDAPSLAKLLTSPAWDDRVLGRSEEARLVNDRLWLVTGNNIRFGGDIAQRTALVHLNPNCARPDLRTGFRIPDLDEWLESTDNRAGLLRALLILARAWITAGAPKADRAMRSFRRWARAMGGFLAYHEVPGFLLNTDELEGQDDEAGQWAGFLTAWHSRYSKPMTAGDLLATAQQMQGFGLPDPWGGLFITRSDGKLPTSKGLGMMLASRRDRFFGEYVLRADRDNHSKVWFYHVDREVKDEAETVSEPSRKAA